MHAGESVSLSDAEQRSLIEFAVKQARGRAPVLCHVSDAGTEIAASRARHAENAGAAAVIATTPYYWSPPPAMVLEHFSQIGSAVRIPFLVFHAPQDMGGTKLTTDLILKLIARCDNFAGVVDASLDWQFMINILSNAQRVRSEFQLLSGTEYMISAGAIGATGMFSSLAAIAPALVRKLYELCRKEQYENARQAQEDLAALRQVVKKSGYAGLKAAMRALGRECGQPRPPLDPMGADDFEKLAAQLGAMSALGTEPRGW
jgi:4-hydroxy-tetrahydrodipicolinate synthase